MINAETKSAITLLVTKAAFTHDVNKADRLVQAADILGNSYGMRFCWTESHGICASLIGPDAEHALKGSEIMHCCGYVVRVDLQRALKNRLTTDPCLAF